jgi:hypothetical protein
MVQVDAVLEDVQDGDHVLGDAGVQQRQDPAVGAQLGDLSHDELVDVRGQLGGMRSKCAGNLRDVLGDGRSCLVHSRMVRRLLCRVTGRGWTVERPCGGDDAPIAGPGKAEWFGWD